MCRDVTMASQNSHFEFEAAILNPKPAVIQSTIMTSKKHEFVLSNILNQNKHKKVKDYLLLTSKGEKPKKGLKKDRK